MNKDFKNGLDKIKCSGEFRKKMNDKLSAPIHEVHEYADSVNHVDRVEGKPFRGIAIGTAACIAVGAGMFGFYKLANKPDMPNDPLFSVAETSPAEEVTAASSEEPAEDTSDPIELSGSVELIDDETTNDSNNLIQSAIDNAYDFFKDPDKRNGTLWFIEGGGQFDACYDVEISDEEFKYVLDTLGTLTYEQFDTDDGEYSDEFYRNAYSSGAVTIRKDYVMFSGSYDNPTPFGSGYSFQPSGEESCEKYAELYNMLEQARYDDVFTIIDYINHGENAVLTYDFIQKWSYSDDTESEGSPDIYYRGSGKLTFNAFSHDNYAGAVGQKILYTYDKEKGRYDFNSIHDSVEFDMEIVNDGYGKSFAREVQHGNFHPVDMDLPYENITTDGDIIREFVDQWYENPDQKSEFACNFDEIPNFIKNFLSARFDAKSIKDHMIVTIDEDVKIINYQIFSEPLVSSKNSEWSLSFSIYQDGILRDYTRTENDAIVAQYSVTYFTPLDHEVEYTETMQNMIDKYKNQ